MNMLVEGHLSANMSFAGQSTNRAPMACLPAEVCTIAGRNTTETGFLGEKFV